MPRTFDLALLRTLVVAADLGGLMRAAPRLGLTPSAVSLQMRRLEAQAGARLFRKEGRRLALAPAGELLLAFARRLLQLNDQGFAALGERASAGAVRLGAPQDVAERWLPRALARFARSRPGVAIEARVDGRVALLEAMEKGQLDLALVLGEPGPGPAERLAELPMTWIASPGLALPSGGVPLPLALLDGPCAFRRAATSALDAAGVPWRLTFTSPSLPAIWAAVEAGLGATVRTPLGVPARLEAGWRGRRLPRLPAVGLWLCGGGDLSPAAAELQQILVDTLRADLAPLATVTRGARRSAGPTREWRRPRGTA
jgi:DNA-binding transcriptional LysR family regulator